MKAKFCLLATILIVILAPCRLHTNADAYMTEERTPDNATLQWAAKIGEGWEKPAGEPIIADDKIYIISGDELCDVEPKNGEILRKVKLAKPQSYGYVAPLYANNTVYMNLSAGTVQAIDSDTLVNKWIYTDSLGGKGMTPLTYSDGLVFTGFWAGEKKDAAFVALDANTGQLKWKMTVNGGFYWAGAYCTDNAVIFATDDGDDKTAHIYSCEKTTGTIISVVDVEGMGDIRSSVSFSKDNSRIYLTSKGGYIISAKLENNVLSDVKYGEIGAASTSTPVVYKNRIYIGAGNKTISVFDAENLSLIFSIPVKAYPQCTPLLSTAYEESEGYIYLYTTYNASPGGVTLIKVKPNAKGVEDCIKQELFCAEGYENYCIANIIAYNSTLYYKNDSGYLFALEQKNAKVKVSAKEAGFLMPQKELKVHAGIAEKYGYTNLNDDTAITALDVMVTIHADMFGNYFTKNTAQEFLQVSSEQGFISKIFGVETTNIGFAVNGKAPHDDVLTSYGYTGLTVSEATVTTGDVIEFFIYRDEWALDKYAYFQKDGERIDSISLNTNESCNVSLVGYCIGWYGCYEESKIADLTDIITDAQLQLADRTTGSFLPADISFCDGTALLSFDKPGKYILSATETYSDEPIIAPWLEINVTGVQWEIIDDCIYVYSNTEREVTLAVAAYENDAMTEVIEFTTIPQGEMVTTVDISAYSDKNFKIYIWDKNLQPIR